MATEPQDNELEVRIKKLEATVGLLAEGAVSRARINANFATLKDELAALDDRVKKLEESR